MATLLLAVVGARGDDPAGAGLDLLVLVDRSGSMAAQSPAVVIDALPLTLNVVAWSSRSARLNHRLGVVSFGSTARVDVPLTLVDADGLPQLRDRIGRLETQSLGNTNFPAAFQAAADVFRALPEDPRRRRAIVLLTDGRPAMPGMREPASAQQLDRLIQSRLATPPVTIDVLLFAPEREASRWRRLSHDRVHPVGGERADVLTAVHRLVTSLVGTRSTQQPMSGGSHTLVLPPYLELVVFDVVRGNAGRPLTVLPPGAAAPLNSQTPGVEEVRVGDVLSTIVVRRPAAGAWTFRKSEGAARVKVLSQQFFPRGTLIDPAATFPVRQHSEAAIVYRLEDGAGRPLRELAGYPLSVDLSLAMPDGRREAMPMTSQPRGAAIYRAMRAAKCDAAGRYWTEVLVTTADSTGQPVRVFEDRWSGFTVEAAEPPPAQASAFPRINNAGVSPARSRWWLILIAAAVLVAGLLVAFGRR